MSNFLITSSNKLKIDAFTNIVKKYLMMPIFYILMLINVNYPINQLMKVVYYVPKKELNLQLIIMLIVFILIIMLLSKIV